MPAEPELVQSGDHLTYYGWAGSTLELFRNGKSLNGSNSRGSTSEWETAFKGEKDRIMARFLRAYWSFRSGSMPIATDEEAVRQLALVLLQLEEYGDPFTDEVTKPANTFDARRRRLGELDDVARKTLSQP